MKAKPTAVDLFCGAGGVTLGLEAAGFEVLCGVDSWSLAVQTYSRNFKTHPVLERDISELTCKDIWETIGGKRAIDLVVGGPPCQGFSIQRIGDDADARNNLVMHFGRLVLELRPRMFLMENVPGLLGKRGKRLAEEFEEHLRSNGYCVKVARINAAAYGAPQQRKRVLFLGWRRELQEPSLPLGQFQEQEFRTVWDAIGDLPTPPEDCSPYPTDPMHRRTRLSQLNLERLRHIPPGGGMQDLPVELRVRCHKGGAEKIGHRYVYGRMAPDKPANTITAKFDSFTRGRFGHPYDDRSISLREGARLQTFPDRFQFMGGQEDIAAQIGNAVPPLVAEMIGRELCSHLLEHAPVKPRNRTAVRSAPEFPLAIC